MPKPTLMLAVAAGYTRPITASGGHYDLELLVQPDVDLDDRFRAFCTATREWLWVNGWMFTTEDVTEDTGAGLDPSDTPTALANGLRVIEGLDAELRAYA